MTNNGAVSLVLAADEVCRSMTRIAHEILERNGSRSEVLLVGLERGGVWIAEFLAIELARISGGSRPDVASIDVSAYRDDLSMRPASTVSGSDPLAVDDRAVVLVDDVLCTGRTVRAALDALVDRGRPRSVQLAVLIDRGHRELPIRPDYVGKNLPTRVGDDVEVTERGVLIHAASEDESPS